MRITQNGTLLSESETLDLLAEAVLMMDSSISVDDAASQLAALPVTQNQKDRAVEYTDTFIRLAGTTFTVMTTSKALIPEATIERDNNDKKMLP